MVIMGKGQNHGAPWGHKDSAMVWVLVLYVVNLSQSPAPHVVPPMHCQGSLQNRVRNSLWALPDLTQYPLPHTPITHKHAQRPGTELSFQRKIKEPVQTTRNLY